MSLRTRKLFGTAVLAVFFATALLTGYLRRVHAAPGQRDEQAAGRPSNLPLAGSQGK